MALDENVVEFTGICRVKHYMSSNKSATYTIQGYALCTRGAILYCCSVMNNGRGNFESDSIAERFVNAFSKMKTPYHRRFKEGDRVEPTSPTALWVLQLAQQYKLNPDV